MLPIKMRLKKDLIGQVLKQGKKIESRGVFLKYLLLPGRQSAFAVVISSKIAKQAVLRNKMKRRGRAVIKKILPFIKEGLLVILFFKKDSLGMKFKELEKEIMDLFKRINLPS